MTLRGLCLLHSVWNLWLSTFLCYKLLISSLYYTATALLGCFPSDLSGGTNINCKDALMGVYQRGSIIDDQEMHTSHESVGQYFGELDYKLPSSWNLITISALVVSNSILSTLKEVDNDTYLFFLARHCDYYLWPQIWLSLRSSWKRQNSRKCAFDFLTWSRINTEIILIPKEYIFAMFVQKAFPK